MITSRPQGKSINVSLRVIADLSQGLYRSPADALKELISNAYDADSAKVEIKFSSDFSSLTIRDWGKGMPIDKFIQIMETIGGSSKRSADEPDVTQSGRKIVGRIGIGLLSVSQIASSLEIESTIDGSTKGFRASIEFDQFASEEARKIKITDLWEGNESIKIGNYSYIEISGVEKKLHFTTLTLSNIKRTIKERLIATKEQDGQERMLGRKFSDIRQLTSWMIKNSITKTGLHEYDRTIWELCVLCPVPYLEKPLSILNKIEDSSKVDEFNEFVEYVNSETHFSLFVDEIQCFKPILMPHKLERQYSLFFNLLFMKGLDKSFVTYNDYDKTGQLVEKKLSVRGYIYFQRPKIWPPELQGITIRVRHVAVGQYDSTFLTYRRHEGFKFSQLTGEILIDELDESLNIDRSSFRETEPAYVALRDAIHNYLAEIVFPGIKSYATEERSYRRDEEYEKQVKVLQKKTKNLKNKKFSFKYNQEKLVTRTGDDITVALSIKDEKKKFDLVYFKIITFLESHLSKKFNSQERDELYDELANWLKQE